LAARTQNPWPLRIWTALILFSQTTWAGEIAGIIATTVFGPGPADVGSPPYLLQKGYHCFLFGVFGWLLARTGKRRPPAQALAIAISVSIFAEMLQLLAPGRHAQWSDAAINIVSSSAVWALASRRPPTL